jgi:hypothetical protein
MACLRAQHRSLLLACAVLAAATVLFPAVASAAGSGSCIEALTTRLELLSVPSNQQLFSSNGKGWNDLGDYRKCFDASDKFCTVAYSYLFRPDPSLANQTETLVAVNGLCLPSVCSDQDVMDNALYLLSEVWTIDDVQTIHEVDCDMDEKALSSSGESAMVIFLVVVMLLVIISTFMFNIVEKNRRDTIKQSFKNLFLVVMDESLQPLLYSSPMGSTSTNPSAGGGLIGGGGGSSSGGGGGGGGGSSGLDGGGKNTSLVGGGKCQASNTVVLPPATIQGLSRWQGMLYSFALPISLARVTARTARANRLHIFDMFRVLGLTWSLLGYTALYLTVAAADSIYFEQTLRTSPTFQFVLNAGLAVDMVLISGGFLAMYQILARFKTFQDAPRGWMAVKWALLLTFMRIVRLAPTILLAALYVMFIFPMHGSGPLWEEAVHRPEFAQCSKTVWTNLLLINNFYPKQFDGDAPNGLGCLSWTWFLAVEAQLFVCVPLLAMLHFHHRRAFRWLTGALILGNALSNGLLAHFLELYYCENHFSGFESSLPMLTHSYNKPWIHVNTYMMGVLMAACYYDLEMPNQVKKPVLWVKVTALVSAALCLCLPVWGTVTAFRKADEVNENSCAWSAVVNELYLATRHLAFGTGLSIIATACLFGWGGAIESISRWHGFLPLSRISLSAFLVGPIIIVTYIFSSSSYWQYTALSFVLFYLVVFITSLIAGWLWFLLLEVPLRTFRVLFLPRLW